MRKKWIVALLAVFALAASLCPGLALADDAELQGGTLKAQDGDVSGVRIVRVGGFDRLFSDDTVQFGISTADVRGEESTDWQLVVRVGQAFSFNDETGVFEHPLNQGSDYTYDEATKTVSVNGEATAQTLNSIGGPRAIVIRARIVNPTTGALMGEAIDSVQVLEAHADRIQEPNCHMLPNWTKWIDPQYGMFVQNSAYPDGRDFSYEVTDVQVVSETPENNGTVLEIEKNDNAWVCRAQNYGTATLKVTYKDPDELGGAEGSYEFNVTVARDVYEANIDTETGSQIALPGKTIKLVARCRHDWDENSQVADEEFTYSWKLLGFGEEFATIAADAQDSSKATVTFREPAADEADRYMREEIPVEVVVHGKDGVNRASKETHLTMASDYVELWPTRNTRDLDEGAEETVEVELRMYPGTGDSEYNLITDARYRWNFDANDMQILAEDGTEVQSGQTVTGTKFTIKRLKGWQIGFNLEAEWGEDGYPDRQFEYDELHYDEPTDIHDLDSINTDMYFDDFEGVVHDRINGMNPNYYVVPATIAPDFLNSLQVRVGGTFSFEENTHNGELLNPQTDYQVSYFKADPASREQNILPLADAAMGEALGSAPTEAGSYLMKVEGKGDYYNCNAVMFDIQDSMENVEISAIPDQMGTGNAVEPKLSIAYKGRTLVEGIDYKVEYSNNVQAGANTATATISGMNNITKWGFVPIGPNRAEVIFTAMDADRFFDGTKSVSFTIVEPEWAAPTYAWSSDYKTVTAKRVCTNFANQAQTEKVTTTAKVTKAATCTTKGETTYTATFKNAAFAQQEKKIANIAAKGHSWGAPTYTWSADHKKVTAKRVCKANKAHVQKETVNTTAKVTKAATYTAKGITTYTATFKNKAFAKQAKSFANIAKLLKKQPMKVSTASKQVAFAKVKKSAQKVKPITVKSAKGTVSYKKTGGNAASKKALSINVKTGQVTVKKGTKKGTYAIKVKVSAAGNKQFKAGSKTVTVKVVVK